MRSTCHKCREECASSALSTGHLCSALADSLGWYERMQGPVTDAESTSRSTLESGETASGLTPTVAGKEFYVTSPGAAQGSSDAAPSMQAQLPLLSCRILQSAGGHNCKC